MLDAIQKGSPKGLFIGGSWVPTPRSFADLNPSDNSLYADIPDGTRADMTRAIEAAQAAYPAGPRSASRNVPMRF